MWIIKCVIFRNVNFQEITLSGLAMLIQGPDLDLDFRRVPVIHGMLAKSASFSFWFANQ